MTPKSPLDTRRSPCTRSTAPAAEWLRCELPAAHCSSLRARNWRGLAQRVFMPVVRPAGENGCSRDKANRCPPRRVLSGDRCHSWRMAVAAALRTASRARLNAQTRTDHDGPRTGDRAPALSVAWRNQSRDPGRTRLAKSSVVGRSQHTAQTVDSDTSSTAPRPGTPVTGGVRPPIGSIDQALWSHSPCIGRPCTRFQLPCVGRRNSHGFRTQLAGPHVRRRRRCGRLRRRRSQTLAALRRPSTAASYAPPPQFP
jgi:hypothetical protein